jgi:predicted TIM-barrel enzyme
MTKENLALSSRRIGVSGVITFPKLVVSFDIDMRALLKRLQVGVGRRVERVDSVPRGSRLNAS